MFFTKEESKNLIESSIDVYGDSFARDISIDELREVRWLTTHHVTRVLISPKIFERMPNKFEHTFNSSRFKTELADHDHDLGILPGCMFEGVLLYADYQDSSESNGAGNGVLPQALEAPGFRMKQAINTAKFAGADFATDLVVEGITHVLVGNDKSRLRTLREELSRYGYLRISRRSLFADHLSRRKRLPRLVTVDWIEQSWAERTLLDEERKISRSKTSTQGQNIIDTAVGFAIS